MKFVLYHMIAFLAGFVIDLCVGDPYWLPHPIRWIGSLIQQLEKWLYRKQSAFARGFILVILTLLITVTVASSVLVCAYWIHPYAGIVVESIMTYYILATKCLKKESMKVCHALEKNDTEAARYAVSMIVGRDTAELDEMGIAKAAIETVAENASDGVIAPMLFTALGGPVLGFFYKAVNTMDSMIGYKNDRYLHFGTAAARLDDISNFIPSRICALFFVICAALNPETSGKNAWKIFRRDRYRHKSPNSAQTESACAGALNIQLAGPASYFGKMVDKPTIGDAIRPVEYADIRRVNRLMLQVAFFNEILCLSVMMLIWWL